MEICWIAAKFRNRAGKESYKKYSSCWNIQTIHKGEPKVLNFNRNVPKWSVNINSVRW